MLSNIMNYMYAQPSEGQQEQPQGGIKLSIEIEKSQSGKVPEIAKRLQMTLTQDGKVLTLEQIQKKLQDSEKKRSDKINSRLSRVRAHNNHVRTGNQQTKQAKLLKLQERQEKLQAKLKKSEQQKKKNLTEKLAKLTAHNANIKPSAEYVKLLQEQRKVQKQDELDAKLKKCEKKRQEELNQKLTKLNAHNSQVGKKVVQEKKELIFREKAQLLEAKHKKAEINKEEIKNQVMERGRIEVLKVLKVKERRSSEEKACYEQVVAKLDKKMTHGEEKRKEILTKIVETTKAHNSKVETQSQQADLQKKEHTELLKDNLKMRLDRADKNRQMRLDQIKQTAVMSFKRDTSQSKSPSKLAANPVIDHCH